MKKRFIKAASAILCMAMLITSLAGCGSKQPSPEEEAAAAAAAKVQRELVEVNQNDYRGAVMRVEAIKSAMMNIVEGFNERNQAITSQRPSDFWNSDSYKYLDTNLLNHSMWEPTIYFNETETAWQDVVNATTALFYIEGTTNLKVNDLSIEHPEANSYKLIYRENAKVPFYKNGEQTYNFLTHYEVTYDANHDWARCVRYREFSDHKLYDGLFEYARISDTEFVVQTTTERLYVKYAEGLYDYNEPKTETSEVSENAESGTAQESQAQPETEENTPAELHNPLKEKPIVEFYYTQLNGEPRYSYAEVVVPENEKPFFSFFDEDGSAVRMGFTNVDENDKYVCIYDAENDSIFKDLSAVGNKDWVFADKGRFKLSFEYYDYMMTVKNENQLVNILECTNFLADGTTEKFEEEIYVPEIILAKTDDEIVEALDESNHDIISDIMLLTTNGFNFGEGISFENQITNRNMTNVFYDGKNYDTSKNGEADQLRRMLLGKYTGLRTEDFIDNEFAIPAGKIYFVSTVSKDIDGNTASDNSNYYAMLYEYSVQDSVTIKYNTYYYVSDNPDCLVTLQNIKPRITTRERVEASYGVPLDLSSVEILDKDGFVQYTASFPTDMVAYRCENGILYVKYNENNIVELVGMYSFDEPQTVDTIYTLPEEEPADTKNKKR